MIINSEDVVELKYILLIFFVNKNILYLFAYLNIDNYFTNSNQNNLHFLIIKFFKYNS